VREAFRELGFGCLISGSGIALCLCFTRPDMKGAERLRFSYRLGVPHRPALRPPPLAGRARGRASLVTAKIDATTVLATLDEPSALDGLVNRTCSLAHRL
jgi:hypothetical protein